MPTLNQNISALTRLIDASPKGWKSITTTHQLFEALLRLDVETSNFDNLHAGADDGYNLSVEARSPDKYGGPIEIRGGCGYGSEISGHITEDEATLSFLSCGGHSIKISLTPQDGYKNWEVTIEADGEYSASSWGDKQEGSDASKERAEWFAKKLEEKLTDFWAGNFQFSAEPSSAALAKEKAAADPSIDWG